VQAEATTGFEAISFETENPTRHFGFYCEQVLCPD
jgi:hypothetical protein